MKVGILTFQNANNFGAVLQAYALQHYLLQNDVDCEFINYNMNANNKNIHIKDIKVSKIKDKFLFLKNIDKYKKIRKFNKFRKKYLKINRKEYFIDQQFYESDIDYDIIIVGSDQVWNSKIINDSKVFYLDFTDKAIKISYAASFGHEILTAKEQEYIKTYLKKFQAVSVREKQVVNMLQKYTDQKIQHVTDPVFLLNKNQWESIMKPYKMHQKYIFVYLMEKVTEINQIIWYINKDSNYKVVYCGQGDNINNATKIEDIGPSEFLFLMNNAEVVITNSFHGTAFSILFEKNFFVISHSRYNARIENMVDLIGEKQKIITIGEKRTIITNERDIKEKQIVAKNKIENMKLEIQKSKEFIKNNIIDYIRRK